MKFYLSIELDNIEMTSIGHNTDTIANELIMEAIYPFFLEKYHTDNVNIGIAIDEDETKKESKNTVKN